jgi:hypothetical protein
MSTTRVIDPSRTGSPARKARRARPVREERVVPTTRARDDIEHQKALDAARRAEWPCFHQRHLAVLDALEAVTRHEEGSRWALRQALVDLAAVSENMAEGMKPPRLRDKAA